MDYNNTWEQCWLNYRKINNNRHLLKSVSIIGVSKKEIIIAQLLNELYLASKAMVGKQITLTKNQGTIIIILDENLNFGIDSFKIKIKDDTCCIESSTKTGLLYGVFHLLRLLSCEKELKNISIIKKAKISLRMLNHWDNIDGSIERGYSGASLFFNGGELIVSERTVDYARLISSIGINSILINNVNVKKGAEYLIDKKYYEQLSKFTKILGRYGIKVFLSVNFSSPILIGGLNTADPCAINVISWWKEKLDSLFKNVDNLGGIVVKADSEGEPGPFDYNRDHAQGANLFAAILKKYDAIVIWRCFVYNSQQNWRDSTVDRAKASYENFLPYDGKFLNNVYLQIKFGPMDFQIREPISPLFGKLNQTNIILEVQLAQEYTGQQIDVCYLIPMFKEILDFKMKGDDEEKIIKNIISSKLKDDISGGIAAVSNTGNSENWTSSDLAAANLYGYGRLAFETELNLVDITKEWINQTFGIDEDVNKIILNILLNSRETYEKYTTPFGIGWMVTPNTHYGPNINGYEYSKWGTYHKATHNAIGIDRTKKGTGFTTQYYPELSQLYDDKINCPENLLLFFHRVEYNERLKNGETLIQNIYNKHFEGVESVENMINKFKTLEGKIPLDKFVRIMNKFEDQLCNAIEWRDQVNSYFFRISGIPDKFDREIF